MDKDSIPIPGVTIKIKETNLGVATDKEGKFSLTFPEMKNRLLCSRLSVCKNRRSRYKRKQCSERDYARRDQSIRRCSGNRICHDP